MGAPTTLVEASATPTAPALTKQHPSLASPVAAWRVSFGTVMHCSVQVRALARFERTMDKHGKEYCLTGIGLSSGDLLLTAASLWVVVLSQTYSADTHIVRGEGARSTAQHPLST